MWHLSHQCQCTLCKKECITLMLERIHWIHSLFLCLTLKKNYLMYSGIPMPTWCFRVGHLSHLSSSLFSLHHLYWIAGVSWPSQYGYRNFQRPCSSEGFMYKNPWWKVTRKSTSNKHTLEILLLHNIWERLSVLSAALHVKFCEKVIVTWAVI